MIAIAAKFKTVAASAAIAAALASGAAFSAAAQSGDPFVGVQPKADTAPFGRHNAPNPNEGNQFVKRTDPTDPNVGRPKPTPNHQGNQFGPQGPQPGSTDVRLAQFLVGNWDGRLTNGQTVKVAFARNGGFAIAMNGSDVVQVGRYTVSGGVIRLQLHSMCSLSTKRCQRFDKVRATAIGFRPIDGSSIQVQDGVLRRTAA